MRLLSSLSVFGGLRSGLAVALRSWCHAFWTTRGGEAGSNQRVGDNALHLVWVGCRGHGMGLRLGLVAGLFLWVATWAGATPYVSGETYFGRNNYIEYRAGDMPLILVTGHDGDLRPEEIPDRPRGVYARDMQTLPLTLACEAELIARSGGRRPHVIINHLHRRKLDPNRPIEEAAGGDPKGEQAWREFHGFIEAARAQAERDYGFGLTVDVHGHGHPIRRLELGYLLNARDLNQDDEGLNHPSMLWKSSLRTLAITRPEVAFADLVRGPGSLGDLFTQAGVPAWPSPQFPKIGEAAFFSGGYITAHHSCREDDGPLHAVQIECHFPGVRQTPEERENFARVLAGVLETFMADNYGHALLDRRAGERAGAKPRRSLFSWFKSSGPELRLSGAWEERTWRDTSEHERHAAGFPAHAAPVETEGPRRGLVAVRLNGEDQALAVPRFPLAKDGAFTLAFYFKLESDGAKGGQNLVVRGNGESLRVHLTDVWEPGATAKLATQMPGLEEGSLDVAGPGRTGWMNGRWYHYLLTVEAEGTAKVYVDGELKVEATGRTGDLGRDGVLWLGWRPGAEEGGFMRGALADVLVHPRAVNATEVARFYHRR